MTGKHIRVFVMAAIVVFMALGVLAISAAAEETTELKPEQTIVAMSDLEGRVTALGKDLVDIKIKVGIVVGIAAFFGVGTLAGLLSLGKMIKSRLEKILDEKIDGEDPLSNLKRTVKREQLAKSMKVLFAASDKNDAMPSSEFSALRRFFKDQQGYKNVSNETVVLTETNCAKETDGFDVIVFCVAKNEAEGLLPAGQKAIYSHVIDLERPCILYAAGIRVDPKETSKPHVSLVNFHAKLRETLYMLLHFSPLNKE